MQTDYEDLEQLARLLDTKFRVPILGWRFGLDSLMGLVPGVGDAATLLPALYLVGRAALGGARKRVILMMLVNTGLDATVGAVPIIGDAFDFFYRSNLRNLRMLSKELERRAAAATAETR